MAGGSWAPGNDCPEGHIPENMIAVVKGWPTTRGLMSGPRHEFEKLLFIRFLLWTERSNIPFSVERFLNDPVFGNVRFKLDQRADIECIRTSKNAFLVFKSNLLENIPEVHRLRLKAIKYEDKIQDVIKDFFYYRINAYPSTF